jgi:hypothetical protein
VVLAHLSETNTHPEVARLETEPALRAAGRGEVRLEIAGRDGTGWIEVAAAHAQRPSLRRDGQYRLF